MENVVMGGKGGTPIVLVELGRHIPKFVKNNLKYLARSFPQNHIFLLTDQNLKGDNFQVIHTSELENSDGLKKFDYLQKKFNSNLQRNYWISTTRRFFYLEMLMTQLETNELVHIESDVLILDSRALLQEASQQFELAYSMQSKELGCAGIFIVKSTRHLRDFLKFTNDNWSFADTTDMTLLANWRALPRNSGKVRVLNPIPNQLISEIELLGDALNFDPGDFGIYFFGNDARHNRWPIRKKRQITNPGSFSMLQLKKYKIQGKLRKNKEGYLCLELKANNRLVFLNTIHMHSKSMPTSILQLRIMITLRNLSHRFISASYIVLPFPSIDYRVLGERALSFFARKRLFPKKYIDFRLR
jgi:hypothetical protein